MKNILLITTFVFTLTVVNKQVNAQLPNWTWAKSAGENYFSEYGRNISSDSNGNVFVVGYFQSPYIIFGNDTLYNADNSGYSYDVFLTKYDSLGNVLWAKSAGGHSMDEGYGVCTDVNGNVIITGRFQSDSIIFDNYTLLNGGVNDIFITKYNSTGNVLWSKRFGGIYYERGYDINTDINGNILLTGLFYSPTIIFGNDTLVRSGSNGDVFITKFDSLGNALWARSAKDAMSYSIDSDTHGNIAIAGWFYGVNIIFGNDTLTNSSNSSDIFIAKYDPFGNVLWAKCAGGIKEDKCNSISIDQNDNLFITGKFVSQSIVFGNDTIINLGYNGYIYDIFIVKYDSSGNTIWARCTGGLLTGDEGWCIKNDINGNAWLTGVINSANSSKVYIAKYDVFGNNLWTDSIGTTSSGGAIGYGLDIDINGNILLTGFFSCPVLTFGNNTLINSDNSSNSSDIFVAKLIYGTTSILEDHNLITLNIYPNPFSSHTILQSNYYLQNASIEIYNTLGQTVSQLKNISGHTITLNCDNLQNGLYLMKLTQGNKTLSVDKLIIND